MNEKKQGLSLGGNMLWNSVGSFFYFACQYLPTILVVRLAADLNASGVFNYAMNTTNTFLALAIYGMRAYQVSDLDRKYSDREYVSSRVLTSLFAACICAAYGAVLGLDGQTFAALMLFMLFRIGEALVDVYSGIDQRAERMDIIGISFIARGFLSVAGFTAAMALTGNLLLSIALMAAASLGVALIFDRAFASKLGETGGKASFGRLKALLTECAPLMVYSFLNTAISTIPRQFLQLQHGSVATAIYGSITAPTVILQLGATYIYTPMIGLFTRRWLGREKRPFYGLVGRVMAAIAGIGIAGVIGVKILGKWGLTLLYSSGDNGQQIIENRALLVPMVFCTVLTASVLFFNMLLTIVREFKGLVAANVIGIIACVAASALLVKPLGMWGTSYALMIGLGAQLLSLVFFGRRCAKKHFDGKPAEGIE